MAGGAATDRQAPCWRVAWRVFSPLQSELPDLVFDLIDGLIQVANGVCEVLQSLGDQRDGWICR